MKGLNTYAVSKRSGASDCKHCVTLGIAKDPRTSSIQTSTTLGDLNKCSCWGARLWECSDNEAYRKGDLGLTELIWFKLH